MPITRKQLSAAASTSNPPLRTSKSVSASHNNLPVSDDDLFEQSAIQVSSASRQTRTINHQIPKEIRKQLHGDFVAAAGLDKEKFVGNRTRTLIRRSIVTSNISLPSAKKIIPSNSEEKTPKENVIPNDSIFDVPVSSSSPQRTAPIQAIQIQQQQQCTPVKTINPKIASLTTPSRQIIAGVRRTPLTMAEKKRRQTEELTKSELKQSEPVNSEPPQKKSETKQIEVKEIDPFDIIDITRSNEAEEDFDDDDDGTIVKNKHIIINKHNENIKFKHKDKVAGVTVAAVEDVSFFVDMNDKENENNNISLNENTKVELNVNNSIQEQPQLSSTTKRRRRIFVRCQATSESAPPEIKTSEPVNIEFTVTATKNENETVTSIKAPVGIPVNFVDELSLVIEVPPPPKLEDLEILDPELYVKLKSGCLKDDPSIPFISETDRTDIENFLESFASPELAKTMIPVSIIGEGTFSTVYKVIDKTFYECDNTAWVDYSRQNPLDWLKLWRFVYDSFETSDKFVLYRDGKRCVDRHGRSVNDRKSSGSNGKSRLNVLLRRYLLEWSMRSLDSLLPGGEPSENVLSSISPRVLQSAMLRFRPQFIALKRINATSSPQRILDEITFLKYLGGKNNVVPVINGLRSEDQVLVTFPYFFSEEFREFLSSSTLSINSIASYMRSLFISLAHLHHHNVIHRDVKPSNFLYAPENGGRAVLLDFGLAQKVSSSSHHRSSGAANNSGGGQLSTGTLAHQHRLHNSRNGEKERKKVQAVNIILNTLGTGGLTGDDPCEKIVQLTNQLGPGYFNNDPRAGMKASRAGTRGFRAPEVLFKCPNQTTALDIWSAGVILLTLLTRRYPFFQSSDDFDAIVEIANIFGNEEMSNISKIYNRKWQCNVPSVPAKHVTWPLLCQNLNPGFAPEIPPECYDLLKECLNLNGEKRITARSALKHEFILKYAK